MTPHNILLVIQFIKDKCFVDQYFEKPDSYLKKLWQRHSYEDKINYLITILSSYDESLLFFEELFSVLSASLTPEQREEIEIYYHSLSESDYDECLHEQQKGAVREESEEDNQMNNERVPKEHEN